MIGQSKGLISSTTHIPPPGYNAPQNIIMSPPPPQLQVIDNQQRNIV
jgi:hypothetical protein